MNVKTKIFSIAILLIVSFLIPLTALIPGIQTPNINNEDLNSSESPTYIELKAPTDLMTGYLTFENKEDYYKAYCVKDTQLKIKKISIITEPEEEKPTYSIEIRDPNGNVINSYTDPDEISLTIATTGYHYIKFSYAFKDYTLTYEFKVDFNDGLGIQWVEPDYYYHLFGESGTAVFNYSFNHYSSGNVNFKLLMNGKVIDEGDLEGTGYTTKTVDLIEIGKYAELDSKHITAVLEIYKNSELLDTDTRYFKFGKMEKDEICILNESISVVGDVLYAILYDPNGDRSWSSFEEGTRLELAVGASISVGIGLGIETSSDGTLFDFIGTGGTLGAYVYETFEAGFEKKWTTTTSEVITSSKDEEDPNYIGPGYGDIYWGEGWTLPWRLEARNTTYYNGTVKVYEPHLKWGIIRQSELIVGKDLAPKNWTDQHPNNLENPGEYIVEEELITVSEGGTAGHTVEVKNTVGISTSVKLDIGAYASGKLGGYKTELKLDISTKVFCEGSQQNWLTKKYHMQDHNAGDIISNYVGVDRRWGTWYFKTEPETCWTSDPWEHNTYDYVGPVINLPTITPDPSEIYEDISPQIDVVITDEMGVDYADVVYSVNGGPEWYVSLDPLGNDNYRAFIPAQEHGAVVEWYIHASDENGHIEDLYDIGNVPWSYTVINRDPTVTLINPNGGEEYESTILINWSASDLDNDDLTYKLSYNIDGMGWRLIDTDIKDMFYLWDISKVEASNFVQLRVEVDDGYGGTTEDISDYVFTIINTGEIGDDEDNVDNVNDSKEKADNVNSELMLPILLIAFIGCAVVIEIRKVTKSKDEKITGKKMKQKAIQKRNVLMKTVKAKQIDKNNLTILSDKFYKKLGEFKLDETDKKEILKEMLSFTPQEREELLDQMINNGKKMELTIIPNSKIQTPESVVKRLVNRMDKIDMLRYKKLRINKMVNQLDQDFKTGKINQETYSWKKNFLGEKIGVIETEIQKLKE